MRSFFGSLRFRLIALVSAARLPAGSVLAIVDDHGTMIAKHPNSEKRSAG